MLNITLFFFLFAAFCYAPYHYYASFFNYEKCQIRAKIKDYHEPHHSLLSLTYDPISFYPSSQPPTHTPTHTNYFEAEFISILVYTSERDSPELILKHKYQDAVGNSLVGLQCFPYTALFDEAPDVRRDPHLHLIGTLISLLIFEFCNPPPRPPAFCLTVYLLKKTRLSCVLHSDFC